MSVSPFETKENNNISLFYFPLSSHSIGKRTITFQLLEGESLHRLQNGVAYPEILCLIR
jgi:hypothetical protein